MFFKTISYFEQLPTGAHYSANEVLKDGCHPIHSSLVEDLNNITSDELYKFASEYRIEKRIGRAENKDLATRLLYFEFEVSKEIASKRLQQLLISEENERPKPYDSEELKNLPIDENGLLELNNLDCLDFGLGYGKFAYQICPSLEQHNSSHWLGELIMAETFGSKRNFKIRLDPLMKVPKEEYRPHFYRMNLYGTKMDWHKLKDLRNEDFGQWLGDKFSTSTTSITDYVWSPYKDAIHFTCEELPKLEHLTFRGSRYFHAIFDRQNGQIVHCDGALRIYDEHEYKTRLNYHVRHSEVRKVGKRVKLFQIDEPIDQQLFMNLATNFLVWNYDALKYFN